MFSGIVEAIALIHAVQRVSGTKHLIIERPSSFSALTVGESIAVNGVCLTITFYDHDYFYVTAVPETLRCTNLDALTSGDIVNLERALRLDSRVGGHLVQGHIDTMGKILELVALDDALTRLMKVSLPAHLSRYVITKGFIALDGMSLTIIQVSDTWFSVTLIPHTQAVTVSKTYKIDQSINIEVDMISKYIEKMVGVYANARNN